MKYPQSLRTNGRIGFVAPSFGCATEPYRSGFKNAQKKLGELGYSLDLGFNCYEERGIGISNTPKECARELMAYYLSPENDVLISCGGGELMCEILEYMDFERLRTVAPKWFMGYSDNTNFTYLLTTLCDTASIYGPCAAAFGMEPWHPAIEDALGILTGRVRQVTGYDKWEKEALKSEENPLAPYHVTEERNLKLWEPSSDGIISGLSGNASAAFRGRLLGGCMDCLVTLLGTGFDRTAEFVERYKEDGIIWFLEACDINVFSIRRAMWQMEQAGWFRHVKGFLFGRPRAAEPMMGLDAYEAVLSTASRYHVPVAFDLDIGHLPPMMPLIVGSLAQVQINGNHITIEMQER
ncbi:MAG: LD-carboxypeptidase [Roseburia sp.]|nr:LD-carboxypeptidase [Roseburia sp.]